MTEYKISLMWTPLVRNGDDGNEFKVLYNVEEVCPSCVQNTHKTTLDKSAACSSTDLNRCHFWNFDRVGEMLICLQFIYIDGHLLFLLVRSNANIWDKGPPSCCKHDIYSHLPTPVSSSLHPTHWWRWIWLQAHTPSHTETHPLPLCAVGCDPCPSVGHAHALIRSNMQKRNDVRISICVRSALPQSLFFLFFIQHIVRRRR